MSASVTIRIEDRVGPALQRVLEGIGGPARAEMNQIAGRAATEALRTYHRQFDTGGGWFNRSLPTWGAGRSRTQWPRDVTRAWSTGPATPNRVEITNAHPHFRAKVFGATIRPRGRALTIPIDPQAHGRTVEQFERATRTRVFRPPGRDVLMFRSVGGRAKVAYVLRRQVVLSPWPGALPEESVYIDPFVRTIGERVAQFL